MTNNDRPIEFDALCLVKSRTLLIRDDATLALHGEPHMRPYYNERVLREFRDIAAILGFDLVPKPVAEVSDAVVEAA